MTHAGFWVDGAVRKPEQRHFDKDDFIHCKWKASETNYDVCTNRFKKWDRVYWLDTTPRESLTPAELLSVAKVISPKASRVEKRNDGPFTFWIVDDEDSAVKVDWGNLTQYPPPVEPQWIRITRENVGQYLFHPCRCREFDQGEWRDGHIVGWCIEDDCCLVESDEHERERVLTWNIVEVQNASTP